MKALITAWSGSPKKPAPAHAGVRPHRNFHESKVSSGIICDRKAAVRFEWDPRKAAGNVKKHGISFQEAATVFGDPLAITFQDPDHSEEEERQMTFGLSLQKRLIVVSHTQRKDRTRIISARPMDRKERVIYEEG
jgi:uncharacterized protein